MAKEEFMIYEDRQYLDNRLTELRTFFEKSVVKGLDVEKIGGVFRYILKTQVGDGSWPAEYKMWTVVQTALVLKALALLGYTPKSTWRITAENKQTRGGIGKAFDFFKERNIKGHPDEISSKRIEDIWDACQVMLAYASYGRQNECQDTARYIGAHWRRVYKRSLENHEIDWRGPAFLAAMLDVFLAYNLDQERIQEVVKALLQIGNVGGQDYSGFLWRDSKAEPCWHAGLILRTLGSLPDYILNKQTKSEIFCNVAEALLNEREDLNGIKSAWWGRKAIIQHVPMHTARVLEGLTSVFSYLSEPIAKLVTDAIEQGNQYIFSEIDPNNDYQIYTSKTTIAVAEYFASLVTSVPVGLLIDTAECLSKQIEVNDARRSALTGYDGFDEVEGGLRIAWLSDLHIAQVNDSDRPFALEPKRTKWFRSLFLEKRNHWTESFASKNLDLIMERIGEQKMNHVLITGDITNLALDEQFKIAREKFLSFQASIGEKTDGTKLSCNFWTILPGNHDVREFLPGAKLSKFFQAFGEVLPKQIFPMTKVIPSPAKSSKLKLALICLDSTPNYPVKMVGMNAQGYLGKEQKGRLKQLLSSGSLNGQVAVVALHHAPVLIPYFKSRLMEYFMSLDADDANELITGCCTYDVKAVLHGHFHTYSPWRAPIGVPDEVRGYMPIIGAPCGTTGTPKQSVEFLELREVEVEKGRETVPGLALAMHELDESGWEERKLDVVIF